MSRKKKITTAIFLLALGGLLFLALMPSPVSVSTSAARHGYFAEYVEDEGYTRLRDTYTISAPISGLLRRLELEPGDQVTAGDAVFTIEPAPAPALDVRTRDQARENLLAARARLEMARAEHHSRDVEARFAESEYLRQQQLFQRDIIADNVLEKALSDRQRSRAAEQAAAAAVEVARYEMENARAVLEVTEGTRVSAEDTLLSIQAPVSGVVLRRDRCCEGVIQAGEPVLEIGNLDQLEVQVDVLSMDAVRIAKGMRVLLERWGGGEDLEGRVRRVEPAGFKRVSALGVDEQRVPVQVEIISPRLQWQNLGDGFRIEARFVLWEEEEVLQIPTSALFRQADGWKVFTVENRRARLRAVDIGRRSGLSTQILSGLAAGELVITHPGDQVADGVRVNAQN